MVSTDFSEMYKTTLFIVGTGNLVMAITLLFMYVIGKYRNTHFQHSICFLATAMLLISLINYVEWFTPIDQEFLPHSQSLVIFAASFELFLLFYSFIILLNPGFAFRKKIKYELLLILLFVAPSLLVDAGTLAYDLLFGVAILFYSSKFLYSLYVYRKAYRVAQVELQNYYSEEKGKMIQWVNTIFYLLIMIGTASLIVPFTNYIVLTCYNLSLFLAYLYIYVELLRHEPLINAHCYVLVSADVAEKVQAAQQPRTGFLIDRENLFNSWLANRAYCRSGITIEDVAKELNTNRTTLSLFLNSELHLSFYEWISQLRIEMAQQELIENPAMPILDIAIRVGIEDRSNFDKTFKRVVGMSPASYRKSNTPLPSPSL